MSHTVVVLGAGYAGLPAAKRLARQVRPGEVDVILVSESDRFVERPRLHQLATGQQLRDRPLQKYLRGTGVQLRVGHVDRLDLGQRVLTMSGPEGERELRYDSLVYAVGSTTDTQSVPGVARYAHGFGGAGASVRMHERLVRLARWGGSVVVVGGGLTGIETAAEIAESFPDVQVRLVTAGAVGGWLSDAAKAQLAAEFERLGVSVTENAPVREVVSHRLQLTGGGDVPFDLCVWTGGFTVPTLARDSGLKVDGRGRVLTDRRLRALSEENVWALGDAAAVPGPWGDALAMGCRSGGFTGPTGADNVAAVLTGRPEREFIFRYVHECISLGRTRGLVQFLNEDGSPKDRILTGKPALMYKEATLRGAVLLFRNPGPFTPRRRRALVVAGRPEAGSAPVASAPDTAGPRRVARRRPPGVPSTDARHD
jgi:NADH dehydrogenase FAD-containing subunit